MAASDQTYRSQKTLDIVFGASGLLMLISVVLLFAQDYFQPWKPEQRKFRDVDQAVTQRVLLGYDLDAKIKKADALKGAVKNARDNRDSVKNKGVGNAQSEHDRAYNRSAEIKAQYDSKVSLYNIAVDNRDNAPDGSSQHKYYDGESKRFRKETEDLYLRLQGANDALDQAQAELKHKKDELKDAEGELVKQEEALKAVTGKIDLVAKSVAEKGWGFGDFVRRLPILDGFASPLKINQITLEAYPIDYSFKRVTRYDRCTTCHLGIDQEKFSQAALEELNKADTSSDVLKRLRKLYEERKKEGEKLGFNPSDLPDHLLSVHMSEGQIRQFAAHPRLDLFLDPKSPHPLLKFGCTSCHAGQGSATDFSHASHVPNDTAEKARWTKDHDWEMTHAGDWEYPMLAHRFVESSCLKCHHQVTDLIRSGSQEEAPKLLRGYNLIKDFGCYGCHEIAGYKQGQEVGPDLRLELSPPIESVSPAERDKLQADRMNPPGTLRKVGPSLYRLAEKTNTNWVERWIRDPRGFRPDTKMPHFYGVSNNDPSVLPDEQKAFPDIEIQAIAHYLEAESKQYLNGDDIYHRLYKIRLDELEAKRTRLEKEKKTLTEKENNELADVKERLDPNLRKERAPSLQLRETPKKLTEQLIDSKGNLVDPKGIPAQAQGAKLAEGGRLFREKGCLACHSHDGTARNDRDDRGPIRALMSEANFGPNLSRIKAKLAPDGGDPQAKRRWLIQWVLNPNVHNPRTRMPITHLTLEQAAHVADWLLSQNPGSLDDWAMVNKDIKIDDLSRLAGVYLIKAPGGMTRRKVSEVLTTKGDDAVAGFSESEGKKLGWAADERHLIANGDGGVGKQDLLWYVGRKAVSRMGCFGCHDIPGFETAKPIGTALNDWGKKDPDRLAFEDIVAYVNHGHINHGHKGKGYEVVDQLRDASGKVVAKSPDGKDLMDGYFLEALEHHQREGFLYQKLNEPRSYDYDRRLAWDDRLRMPQFRFARKAAKLKESDPVGQQVQESEAREAVMTFILGLVAEPVPSRYRNDPEPDRLAEVKGRQVLDKYNCAGCHLLRSGIYDFKLNDQALSMLGKQFNERARPEMDKGYPELYRDHNAWFGQPQARSDRLRVFAIEARDTEQNDEAGNPFPTKSVRPTQAVHVKIDRPDVLKDLEDVLKDVGNEDSKTFDIPAGVGIDMPADTYLHGSDPYGGTFGDLVLASKYLEGHPNLPATAAEEERRSLLPPPLHREGEKVQPAWLERFLHDPKPIRPPERMLLRMPKFNMSEDEVAALVQYFIAVDRLENPGTASANPRIAQEQLNDDFWVKKNHEYRKRLGAKLKDRGGDKDLTASFQAYLQYLQLPETERKLKDKSAEVKSQEETVKNSPDKEKKDAETRLKQLQDEENSLTELLKKLQDPSKGDSTALLRNQWEKDGVYPTDAYHLLLQRKEASCLECHTIGDHQPNSKRAPTLFFRKDQPPSAPAAGTDHEAYIATERLRPEWTARWIAQPNRLHGYQTIMLQVFERNKPVDIQRQLFEGEQADRIKALRDILMDMPQVQALPGNRYYRWEIGGKK